MSALDRTRRAVWWLASSIPLDRVQHMFFAQKDKGGPHGKVIEEPNMRADKLVGAFEYVDEETALFVIS